MNDGTPVMRRPRQAWPPVVRTAAAVIATAVLALLAACSGSPSSSAGSGGSPNAAGSSSAPSAVAYSACMRSHAVPGWPDPTVEQGRPAFNLLHVHGFDPNSTEIRYTKTSECQRTIQGTLPGGVPEIRPRSPG